MPTSGLKEKIGDMRARVVNLGWDAVVVVNDERVVLGLLRSKELGTDPEQPITTSDGRLVGLLLQKDVAAEMEKMK